MLPEQLSSDYLHLNDFSDLLDSIDYKGSSDDEENCLCNTVLITGPTGVGKTAAVYACAQELGFKVRKGQCQEGVNVMVALKGKPNILPAFIYSSRYLKSMPLLSAVVDKFYLS